MERANKQQEILNQQRPFEEQQARYQRDVQQTQQIIQGVGSIIRMLSEQLSWCRMRVNGLRLHARVVPTSPNGRRSSRVIDRR